MGQFHFDVPETIRDFVEQSLWKQAYICGIEGIPWQCRTQLGDGRLTLQRDIDSSGKLFLTCPLDELGFRTLSTCSLRPLEAPHLLALELARGSCFRARVQADSWRRAGVCLSPEFNELLTEGTDRFLDAAQARRDPDAASRSALEAVAVLERGLEDLGDSFALQSISFRKQREQQIGTLLGGNVVPPAPSEAQQEDFLSAFNSAAVRISWADIETDSGRFDFDAAVSTVRWCNKEGLRVIGGPLLDFRERLMPHWLYLIEDDFSAFLDAVHHFVQRAVSTFRGSVQLWNCAAGLNTPGPLQLDDEQIMRLAVTVLQTVRRMDPNTPAVITFDQPFGEYLAQHREGISPLHFADALARSGLGLAGIGLDLHFNYQCRGTLPRSSVELGDMIDRWATLGLPLLVHFGVPGGQGPDPQAIAPAKVMKPPEPSLDPAAEQLRIAGPILRTLLAKHIVHGIIWDGWSDDEPHVLSHSGLFDASGLSRPMLDYLRRLRRDFLT